MVFTEVIKSTQSHLAGTYPVWLMSFWKGGSSDTETDTDGGEMMWRHAEMRAMWLEWYICEPRKAKDCQLIPRARRKEPFSPTTVTQSMVLLTPWSQTSLPEAWDSKFVLSHPTFRNLLQQSKEVIQRYPEYLYILDKKKTKTPHNSMTKRKPNTLKRSSTLVVITEI